MHYNLILTPMFWYIYELITSCLNYSSFCSKAHIAIRKVFFIISIQNISWNLSSNQYVYSFISVIIKDSISFNFWIHVRVIADTQQYNIQKLKGLQRIYRILSVFAHLAIPFWHKHLIHQGIFCSKTDSIHLKCYADYWTNEMLPK